MRNAHATHINDVLRESEFETFDCAICGDAHLNRGYALECCSDVEELRGGAA